MANMSVTRIQRELADVGRANDDEKGIVNLELNGGQLDRLLGTIKGPPGTPYEGGTFKIDIKIPNEYPFRPPEMRFITKVWHPNVSSMTGAICLDILKTNWAAAMTLRTVLISVQALLSSPVADDPQDAIVAGQFKSNHGLFDLTARYWTHAYAGAASSSGIVEMSRKVAQLVSMGFTETDACNELSWNAWDVNRALEKLAP